MLTSVAFSYDIVLFLVISQKWQGGRFSNTKPLKRVGLSHPVGVIFRLWHVSLCLYAFDETVNKHINSLVYLFSKVLFKKKVHPKYMLTFVAKLFWRWSARKQLFSFLAPHFFNLKDNPYDVNFCPETSGSVGII